VSAASLTARGRLAAEALMLDAGTAKRPTGPPEYVDGVDTIPYDDLFTSACKVQTSGLSALAAEVGARTSVAVRTELHLPAATAPLTVGDLFTVTTPHALSSVPTGTAYRVVAPVGKTFATARRYQVEEVVT
jgi:hypothetical protein